MPEVVYRSTHPDVIAHWEATSSAEAASAWRDKVNEAIAELGFPGRRFATSNGWHGRSVIGVEHPKDAEIPDGWRRDRELTSAIVPAKRTALGKKIAKVLGALLAPNPRKNLPGEMPAVAFGKAQFLHCGVNRHGDAVYVTWSAELDEQDASHIDTTVWERVKLSEYYAVLEAEEAKAS